MKALKIILYIVALVPITLFGMLVAGTGGPIIVILGTLIFLWVIFYLHLFSHVGWRKLAIAWLVFVVSAGGLLAINISYNRHHRNIYRLWESDWNHECSSDDTLAFEQLAFFVHIQNPVDTLTTDQLRAIYTGKITDWSEVGGEDRHIRAYLQGYAASEWAFRCWMQPLQPMRQPVARERQWHFTHRMSGYYNYRNAIGYASREYLEYKFDTTQVKTLKIIEIE